MIVRRKLGFGLTSCALAALTAPALAQSQPPAAPDGYEYAQPLPAPPPVIYLPGEVAQPLPSDTVPTPPDDGGTTNDHPADAPPEPESGYDDNVPTQPSHIAHGYPAAPPYPYPGYPHALPQPAFDRDAWLSACRQRLGYRDGRDEDGVGGGILGAIVGGVIGNRVAGGERLAGTLIGAGVGGLAGIAIGSAIGASARDRDEARAIDECELYLDDYLAGYGRQPVHGHEYGYGYAPPVSYVPVLVMIPQRAVVRETVTEEWIEAAGHARRAVPQRTSPTRATPPAATGKVKHIKGH